MYTVVARVQTQSLIVYGCWICIPMCVALVVVLLSSATMDVVVWAGIVSWGLFGGSFVSHWRCRDAIVLCDHGIVFREPSGAEFLGRISLIRIPRESIQTLEFVETEQMGLTTPGLLLACWPDPQLRQCIAKLPDDSRCSLDDDDPSVLRLRFASVAWQWVDDGMRQMFEFSEYVK